MKVYKGSENRGMDRACPVGRNNLTHQPLWFLSRGGGRSLGFVKEIFPESAWYVVQGGIRQSRGPALSLVFVVCVCAHGEGGEHVRNSNGVLTGSGINQLALIVSTTNHSFTHMPTSPSPPTTRHTYCTAL